MRGEMVITKSAATPADSAIKSRDGSEEFFAYPIKVQDVVIVDDTVGTAKTLTSFSDMSSRFVEVGRSVSQLLTSFSKPGAAVGLDRMVSEFLYLRLVDGPPMYYPNLVLESVSGSSMLPVNIGNPLIDSQSPIRVATIDPSTLTAEDENSCKLSSYFTSNSIKCSLFLNFGEDMVISAVIFVVTLCVSFIFLLAFIGKPRGYEPQGLLSKFFALLGRSYGLKYFFTKIDGMSLEFMVYSAINGLNPLKSVPIVYSGFIISWIIFGMYAIYFILLLKFTSNVRSELNKQNTTKSDPLESPSPKMEVTKVRKSRSPSAKAAAEKTQIQVEPDVKKQKVELAEAVKLHSVKLWIAGGVIEEMKVPKKSFYLYTPLVFLTRNCLLSFTLYLASSKGLIQVGILLFIQGIVLFWMLCTRPKYSSVDNFKECLDNLLSFLYLLMKLISIFELNEDITQNVLGAAMAIILVVLIVSNLLYSFYSVLLVLWGVSQAIFSCCKEDKKSTQSNHSRVTPMLRRETQISASKLSSKSQIMNNQGEIAKQSSQSLLPISSPQFDQTTSTFSSSELIKQRMQRNHQRLIKLHYLK